MEWNIDTLITLGGGALTSIAAYFMGAGKRKAEAKLVQAQAESAIIANVAGTNDIYMDAINLLKQQVAQLQIDLEKTKTKAAEVEARAEREAKEQAHKIANMRNQIDGLYRQVKELEEDKQRLHKIIIDAGLEPPVL